ncbi:hypothetical protein HELRODRAFT_183292 [Helobdella robusta]|uniref:Transmembrane protein n=1 Tax=Helobdella robusta TaxID=6412 RepID=T1FJF4_HELRO|nr:hypothetical protein HELRODRAFT_183292 [Helobdella robusta]ESO11349.1 hypothetical protein HELRODRAFT_183292 [Helobdella robusta]
MKLNTGHTKSLYSVFFNYLNDARMWEGGVNQNRKTIRASVVVVKFFLIATLSAIILRKEKKSNEQVVLVETHTILAKTFKKPSKQSFSHSNATDHTCEEHILSTNWLHDL